MWFGLVGHGKGMHFSQSKNALLLYCLCSEDDFDQATHDRVTYFYFLQVGAQKRAESFLRNVLMPLMHF